MEIFDVAFKFKQSGGGGRGFYSITTVYKIPRVQLFVADFLQ
jgi:hypothetical protein